MAAKTNNSKKTTKTVKADAVLAEKKEAGPIEVKVYSAEGKAKGTIELPSKLFGLPWNADLVHQVVVSMIGNDRQPVADTKDRGEVRGGGRKPWRQKGTGQARHGSRRSPIWIGGGITHGPLSEKKYSRKINKKMKAKALFTILSQKLRDGEILFTEVKAYAEPKTKEAQNYLNNLSKIDGFSKINFKKGSRAIVALSAKDKNTEKSFSNISSANLMELRNVSPLDLMNYKYLVVVDPEKSLEVLATRAQ